MSRLAKNVQFLVALSGLSGNLLAEAIGVTQPTLQRISSGSSKDPKDASLLPIARYFGITVEDLRRGDLATPEAAERIQAHLVATAPKPTAADKKLQASWTIRSLEMDIDQLRATVLILMDMLSEKIQGGAGALSALMSEVPKDYGRKGQGFHAQLVDSLKEFEKREKEASKGAARRGVR